MVWRCVKQFVCQGPVRLSKQQETLGGSLAVRVAGMRPGKKVCDVPVPGMPMLVAWIVVRGPVGIVVFRLSLFSKV